MARDDKELNALLGRIDELGRVLARVEEQRQVIEAEEVAAKAELRHIKESMERAFAQ